MKAGAMKGGVLVALAGIGLTLGGCSLSGGNPIVPQSVRVHVDAPTGVSVQLLTSRAFLVTQTQTDTGVQNSLQLVTADTTWTKSPVDQTFDIRNTQRFLVFVVAADSSNVPVHLKVWLNDQVKYDHTETYPGGNELKFIYVFN